MKFSQNLHMPWLLSYISIASVSAAMITPALPNIESDFALNTGSVEWMVSIFLLGYVIGQLLYAPIANVHGRLKALGWGLDINILGLILCLIASYFSNYTWLLFGRFVTGLGSAAGLTCTFMLINEWLPEQQRKAAMSYSILSFALGSGIAVALGGVITQYTTWQGCFILLLVQGVIMRYGICVFSETLTQPKLFHIPSLLRDYGHALRSAKLVSFAAVWGGCSAVSYCFSAAAPQIAHQYLQMSASEYGYWNILNIIGMLIGGISARYVIQRISVMQLIALGYVGCYCALASLTILWYFEYNSAIWFFTSTALLYGFSCYLFSGGSYIASNAIEDKASASSMMSFINMGVATLSVVIMGYLSHNPFNGFLLILACVFTLTAALVARFVRI